MAFKHNDSCLEKVAGDEPIFVLRAQDKLAPVVVRTWVDIARLHGLPLEKEAEALDLAQSMEDWADANGGKFPD